MMYKLEHKISRGRCCWNICHDIDGPTPSVHISSFDKHLSMHTSKSTCIHLWYSRRQVASQFQHYIIFFFYISPAHSFCSQFFYVSATCWSSRLSFYPLWHRVSCLSDGLVLLGLPASFSSSACWCKSWATQLGRGSCSSRGERKKKKEMQLEWEGLEDDRQTNWRHAQRQLWCQQCFVGVSTMYFLGYVTHLAPISLPTH